MAVHDKKKTKQKRVRAQAQIRERWEDTPGMKWPKALRHDSNQLRGRGKRKREAKAKGGNTGKCQQSIAYADNSVHLRGWGRRL